MRGLIAFLTLLSWYRDQNPNEYEKVKNKIKAMIFSIQKIDAELQAKISHGKLRKVDLEFLYFSIFKNANESELISAIYRFIDYAKEMQLFSKKEMQRITKVLKDFSITIGLIADLYYKESHKEEYVSHRKNYGRR